MSFLDRFTRNVKPRAAHDSATVSGEFPTSMALTEETPFLRPSTEERFQAAPEYLKRQASKLYEMSKNGPLSFHIMAFLGGLALIVAALVDLDDIITLLKSTCIKI